MEVARGADGTGAAAAERLPLIAGLMRKRVREAIRASRRRGMLLFCWEAAGISPAFLLTIVLIFPLMLLKKICWVLSGLLEQNFARAWY